MYNAQKWHMIFFICLSVQAFFYSFHRANIWPHSQCKVHVLIPNLMKIIRIWFTGNEENGKLIYDGENASKVEIPLIFIH